MITKRLRRFIEDVDRVVADTDDQYELTARISPLMAELLTDGYRLPDECTRPSPDHNMTYPLYIAPDDSWCLASVVWDVDQRTPVHGHETWGVVGIYSGIEHEVRFLKPSATAPAAPLTPAGETRWRAGQVTICCTTDDDVHAVVAEGDVPTIGIHVYGGNIGTIQRRRYDPATGAVTWFASGWDPVPA
ncbi:cysteine dioxygenase family protein [Microlunatus parietis]|uniref:Putative metal-dependent enzyme (Double-stranded beta helix superfamily) n=1 Tax=Microlunatus parietis TaxID=682979 RepID=A0A7Y9LDE8_9ACTN|nr:hypothetical protein [Microlunatus parietis]NYE71851.1 putative metal-dependent enzyme (double-stranded beta helix superfamily) [Microlunatus parietis]